MYATEMYVAKMYVRKMFATEMYFSHEAINYSFYHLGAVLYEGTLHWPANISSGSLLCSFAFYC